jgi:hypothetical protein
MGLDELKFAIGQLSNDQFCEFAYWFDGYRAELWDRRIEADIAGGRLDDAGRGADDDFDAGRCIQL